MTTLIGSLPCLSATIPVSGLRNDTNSVRVGDISCNSSRTPRAMITTGIMYGDNRSTSTDIDSWDRVNNDEGMAFISVNIPLGQNDTVDCNKLYEIALQTKEAELKLLQEKLRVLSLKQSLSTQSFSE